MIPTFYRQTAPGVAVQGNAGLAAEAQAGIGAAAARTGRQIANYAERQIARSDYVAASRSWRQLEDWRYRYLQELPKRRKDLAVVTLDPTTGQNRTGYEQELDRFPDALNEQFDRLTESLSREARAQFEGRFNSVAANWSDEAVRSLDALELEDMTGEILDLAGQDRVADAKELFDLYADRYSPADRDRIARAVEAMSLQARAEAVQTDLAAIARNQGWDAADAALQDPEYLKTWGLDLEEAADLKRQVGVFVADQAAADRSNLEIARAAAADTWYADCEQGKGDLTHGLRMVRAGNLSHADYAAGKKILLEGPDLQDDLDVYEEASAKLSAVRNRQMTKSEARAWLRGQRGKLKPETYKGFASDLERAGDPDDPLATPNARLFEKLIDDHYETLGTFGEWGTPEAERMYIDVKQRMRAWLRENPNATDEEASTKYRALVEPIAKPKMLEKIRNVVLRYALPGVARANRPLRRGDYRLPTSDREPATAAQFEEAVKAFAPGSEEQKAYYDRWVKKWQ